ncbi:ground-like domain protein [Cooperia oncophora]
MTAPPATLPPLITMPYAPPPNVVPDYSSQYTTQERPQYNNYNNQASRNYPGPDYGPAPQVMTFPAVEPPTTPPTDSDLEDNDEAFESDCTGELSCTNGQLISEDKCNSLRLRTIIQNNIVPNDAEASKRAVQSAAESETGLFFDAVCGTAHTDEFCLATVGGVNCYLFSPVCGEGSPMTYSKHRKSRRKLYVNRN